ncbi:hypothetical protein ACI797_02160 [Geodermatophilus sp. SYSU D00691]
MAAPPSREVFTDQNMATLPDVDCGSFTLHEDMVSERITRTTFVDDAGVATRILFTISFVGVLTRSDTGETFVDRVAGTDTVDPVTGEFTSTGRKINLHRPGEGTLALTAGRTVRDASGAVVFQAGPADVDVFELTGLCEALA